MTLREQEQLPTVQCYICKRIFRKRVEGAAHNRNFYRCQECLDTQRRASKRRRYL